DAEPLDCGIELQSTAADETRAGQNLDDCVCCHHLPGFCGLDTTHQHLARHDQRLRLLARFYSSALHQKPVEPLLHDLRCTIRLANSCRRSAPPPNGSSAPCASAHSFSAITRDVSTP